VAQITILDLETTGLPASSKVIALAALVIDERGEEVGAHQSLVWPEPGRLARVLQQIRFKFGAADYFLSHHAGFETKFILPEMIGGVPWLASLRVSPSRRHWPLLA
jgi:hypothetical protein